LRRQFISAGASAGAGLLLQGWGSLIRASPGEIYVQKGDTLWGLATRNGVSVDALKKANGLSSDQLQIGQKLRLPGTASSGATVVVKKGDTLAGIARAHGVQVDALRRANGLTGNLIHPGDRLRLPGTAGSPPEKKRVYLDRARKEIDVENLSSRRWEHIILHHSGTPTGSGKIFDYYHRKIKRMENGLAYHFVIGNGSETADGQIEVAERWRRQIQGGHVRSETYNQNSIGICLVGNFERSRPTKKQMKAAVELVDHLKYELLGGHPDLLLHRDIQETVCPGRYFPEKDVHRIFG